MARGKSVTLAASLEFTGGRMLRGYVKSISPTSVGFSSGDFNKYRQNPPKDGDMGVLTMSYTREGTPHDIKVRIRLVQVMGNMATLALMQGDLTKKDTKAMKQIMEIQTSEIGKDADH
ncbi:MAG TPA: hypothetical protein VIX81_09130 [Gammaproteobacteria bacterium]